MTSWYSKAETAVAMALLAAIVVLVFAAGVTRWFGYPLVWSVDLAQLLFVWVSFLGADLALRRRAHIGIDYLIKRLSPRARAGVELALGAVVVAFLLTMARLGWGLTMLNLERQFGDSGISYAFVTVAVPVGCLMMAGSLIEQMWISARGWRGAPPPVFAPAPRALIEGEG